MRVVSRQGKNTGDTFLVRVLYTELGTWQGQVVHVQSGNIHSFQSCLILLDYIKSYVEQELTNNKQKKIRNLFSS